jgi:hypothetical protein
LTFDKFSNILPKISFTKNGEKMKIFKEAIYVAVLGIIVLGLAIEFLRANIMSGPLIIVLSIFPLGGIFIARKKFTRSIPDLIFGAIDTGLLTIPAILGGIRFGIAGAIAGGVIGDAVTDAIAGFFEGGIARWLREKGIEASRDPVTSSLGKMAGCLLGAGIVLTCALLFGVSLMQIS